MLKNDTLDVLECGDFEKVVSDCADDCINLMTDSLEEIFRNMSTGPINNLNNTKDMDENSVGNKQGSLDSDTEAKIVSSKNVLDDGK